MNAIVDTPNLVFTDIQSGGDYLSALPLANPVAAEEKLTVFLDALLARGRIRAMDGVLADFEVTPLRETERVAEQVRQRLALPR